MLSDNFSTEGPCKGTHCKRTAHRKERKEVANSYTFHFFKIFLPGGTVVDLIW